MAPHRFPTLPVSQLQLRDVEAIFHLTQRRRHMNWERMRVPCEIRDSCNELLDRIDRWTSERRGLEEVAPTLRLFFLLGPPFSTSPDPEAGLPHIKVKEIREFSLEPVIHKGSTHCLRGCPNFAVWYRRSDDEYEKAAFNFIIVEQKMGKSLEGIPQALAYMGMIHRQRRYEKKALHPVFGLSTDNDQFHFLQIDTKGKWSQMNTNSSQRQQIVDTLRYIQKEASILSIAEEKTSGTPRNRFCGITGILRWLRQGRQRLDKTVFSVDRDRLIPFVEESEEESDEESEEDSEEESEESE